eukprot:jgi/Psemu1/24031/gm1.24031_g
MKKALFTRKSAKELPENSENSAPKSFFSSPRKTAAANSKDGSSNKGRWSLSNIKNLTGNPGGVDKLLKQINEENRKMEERARKADLRADRAELKADKAEERALKAEERAKKAEAKLETVLENINNIGGSSIFC